MDNTGIYFYSNNNKKYEGFSNYYRSSIFEHNILYKTSEHYYQAHKAINNKNVFNKILVASTPAKTKYIARKYFRDNPVERNNWEYIKYGVMLRALYLKFTQHPYLKKLLLGTGDLNIYEDSPNDRIWGWRDGGLNLLGKALMETRDRIKREKSILNR